MRIGDVREHQHIPAARQQVAENNNRLRRVTAPSPASPLLDLYLRRRVGPLLRDRKITARFSLPAHASQLHAADIIPVADGPAADDYYMPLFHWPGALYCRGDGRVIYFPARERWPPLRRDTAPREFS